MPEHDTPDWQVTYRQQLSPAIQDDIERRALAKEYDDKFSLANQIENAAFGLAALALVRHGRRGYFERHSHCTYEPLATDFLTTGRPMRSGSRIIVPAVKLHAQPVGEYIGRGLYKNIRRARSGKADPHAVAEGLGKAINVITFYGCLLATDRSLLNEEHPPEIIRDAPERLAQRVQRWSLPDGAFFHDAHIEHELSRKPGTIAWSIPAPEIAQQPWQGCTVPLVRSSRPNLEPYKKPEDYKRNAEAGLADLKERVPARMAAMSLLQTALALCITLSSLDGWPKAIATTP